MVYQEIKEKVRDAVIILINQEREGEQIDGALLKNVLDICDEIEKGRSYCFVNDFEAPILVDSAIYYAKKSYNWIVEGSCSYYMIKAEECLKHEKDRVSQYLHSSSCHILLNEVQRVLITSQLLEEVHCSCYALLRDGKVEDLSRIYRLLIKIPEALDLVIIMFKQYIINEGTLLVKQAADPEMKQKFFFEKISELLVKCLVHVNVCFQNHIHFHVALSEAFKSCFDSVPGSSSEILASICDSILKKDGTDETNNEVIEEALKEVVKLLDHISDRNCFAMSYVSKLARRLLRGNAYYENEISILRKLKLKYGLEFTSMMYCMVSDMQSAEVLQENFEEHLNTHPNINLGIGLTATVLTAGLWPNAYLNIEKKMLLPPEMENCAQVFEEFYTKVKRLKWIHSLGTCEVEGNFNTKTITLIVTPYQASLLHLFCASDTLSYSEIVSQLNLPEAEVSSLLHSLSCAKYKILNKVPNTKKISSGDIFEYNANFTNRMRRIKIPLPSCYKDKCIHTDPRYAIDASIIRIMKRERTLTSTRLVEKCIEDLKSKLVEPEVETIKRRINGLVSREFLEEFMDKQQQQQLKFVQTDKYG